MVASLECGIPILKRPGGYGHRRAQHQKGSDEGVLERERHGHPVVGFDCFLVAGTPGMGLVTLRQTFAYRSQVSPCGPESCTVATTVPI